MSCCSWAALAGTTEQKAAGNPLAAPARSGGNMEGKEVRFGIAVSALFATVTTDASCGAVNAMHDSFTPIGGLVPLFNIQLGEIIFGGVGSGLYGMLLFVVVAVFIAGLMVGRTPEYLGKKIEAREIKLSMLGILILPRHPGLPAGRGTPLGVASWTIPGRTACRSALRLRLGDRQQRLRLRRPEREHARSRRDGGLGDAARAFLHHHPGAGDGRLARRQEAPAVGRHFPDPLAAVRRAPRRRDRHRRRPDALPGAGAWPDRRALRHARLVNCSNRTHFGVISMETSRIRKRTPVTALTDPKIVIPGDRLGLRQAQSARDDEEPCDVRGGGRRGARPPSSSFATGCNGGEHLGFTFQIIVWLWFTVLFANFAEAVAEGRGKAQAASLRQTREETKAKLIVDEKTGLIVPTPAGKLGLGTNGAG